jgi:neutral amino acid transport system permease protein
VNILSSSRTNRLARGIAISFLSFIAVLGIAMPASADSVGEEYETAILGNVRVDGEPIQGVRIVVDGNGYTAETVTDEKGRWLIGVPQTGKYNVTLDESTLPEGIAVYRWCLEPLDFQTLPTARW